MAIVRWPIPFLVDHYNIKPALEQVGRGVTVAGWGSVDQFGEIYKPELRKVRVDIYSRKYCNSANDYDDTPMRATQICAGKTNVKKDSCYGDSGGPLFSNYQGYPYLIGIVSSGTDAEGYCAKKTEAGVYTRVSKFNKWIKRHTKLEY